MQRFRDLRRTQKKIWFGMGILTLAALLGAAQWRFDVTEPIRTQVLGAQAKKPDTTPPSVSISFPASGGVYGPATWAGSVSGSASDATGVARVEVAVQQQTGGKYWTGSGFSSPSIVWLASGTASWSQTLPLPALDGAYTVSVKATDTATPASNTSIPLTATFRVDTVAPPAPTFTKTPEDPTFETKAQFNYRDTEAGVLFVCGLDSATPNRCAAAGIEFKNLAVGTHTFTLWAVDAAGNRSASGTTWSWTILENKAFGISGTLSPQLYPGVKLPLDLNLTNPYNFTIRVTSLTVQVTGPRPTGTTACRADVKASGTTAGLALDIPANQSRQLSSFASLASWPEGWPQIDMENTNQNQDACKNTTFTLGYSGTATKS